MRPLLIVVLLVIFLVPQSVSAGVMTKMIEVDSECSRELNVMRVELEEANASNLSLNDRINRLLNDNIVLVAENKSLKEKNAVLTMQITGLKQNNSELATKIQELKSQVEDQTLVQNTPNLTESSKPTNIDDSPKIIQNKNLSNYLWPVISAPIGAVTGTFRGAAYKSIEYSDNASTKAQESLPKALVTKLGGLILGNITGAVTGLLKGFIDGIRYGYSEPFTVKSVSLEGDFVSDWDPYQI